MQRPETKNGKYLIRIVRGCDYSPATALSEDNDILRNITLFEKLGAGTCNNSGVDLVTGNVQCIYKMWLNFVDPFSSY